MSAVYLMVDVCQISAVVQLQRNSRGPNRGRHFRLFCSGSVNVKVTGQFGHVRVMPPAQHGQMETSPVSFWTTAHLASHYRVLSLPQESLAAAATVKAVLVPHIAAILADAAKPMDLNTSVDSFLRFSAISAWSLRWKVYLPSPTDVQLTCTCCKLMAVQQWSARCSTMKGDFSDADAFRS